jgi:excisionase family DNA binding protein
MNDSKAVDDAAETKRLLSAREAPLVLGVSRATLCRLVKAKRIGVFRVGARTLFDNAILQNFMNSIYQPPADAVIVKRKPRTA